MPPKKNKDHSLTDEEGAADESAPAAVTGAPKRAKKATPEVVTDRQDTPRAPAVEGAIKIVSWNVDGIRAEGRLADLVAVVAQEQPDILCLQETKLNGPWDEAWHAALPDYDALWNCCTAKKGYSGTAVFVRRPLPDTKAPTVSGARGFTPVYGPNGLYGDGAGGDEAVKVPAGSAAVPAPKSIASFFSKKLLQKPPSAGAATERAAPTTLAEQLPTGGGGSSQGTPTRPGLPIVSVKFGFGHPEHDDEGRAITVEYEHFFVVALYVPNAGQQLERLEYRVKSWNACLEAFVASLEASSGKPVVVLGDLNVAFQDTDVYNYFAPHLKKQAGCTVEEREAFGAWLNRGYFDAFRQCHGGASGAYTYWSQRNVTARAENKGLRLDYFVCSNSLGDALGGVASGGGTSTAGANKSSSLRVVDCYCLPQLTKTSDHCPIALVLAPRAPEGAARD